jgi:protein-tyrosine phosphatase
VKKSLDVHYERCCVKSQMTHIFFVKALDNSIVEDLDEIVPGLFLGNLEQAFNPTCLQNHKITHIVNVCQSENVFEHGIEKALERVNQLHRLDEFSGFVAPQYIRVALADQPTEPIYTHFDRVFQFIDLAQSKQDSRILVHCHAGISRSSSIVIAYLMYRYQYVLDEAFLRVKEKRAKIRPNPGFCVQLIEYHKSRYGDCGFQSFEKRFKKDIAQFQ